MEVAANFENLEINQDQASFSERILDFISPAGYTKWYLDHKISVDKYPELLSAMENSDVFAVPENLQKYVFVELIGMTMNVAFLHIAAGKKTEAALSIEKAENILLRCQQYFNPEDNTIKLKDTDHYIGSCIVLQSLKILQAVQFKTDLNLKVFETSNKSKAMIKIFESYFLGQFSPDHEKELQLVNEAIKLDKDWEWYEIKSRRIRWRKRRQPIFGINSDKISELQNAIELNPNHPRITIRKIELLGETLRKQEQEHMLLLSWGWRLGPWRNQNRNLNMFGKNWTEVDALRYLRESAKDFEMHYPVPGWLNVMGRIFGSELRRRDPIFALQLLDKALEIAPNSSKINHRKAIILVNNDQFDEAENFILRAVTADKRNIHASLDLAKLFLRNSNASKSNQVHLEMIFENISKNLSNGNEKPSNAYIGLIFLKGFHLYQIGRIQDSLDAWAQWAELVSTSSFADLSFKKLALRGFLKNWGWQLDQTEKDALFANLRKKLHLTSPRSTKFLQDQLNF